MRPERWQRISRLYYDAAQCEGSQQAAFLDQVCADDAGLRAELDALLAGDEGGDALLDDRITHPVLSLVGRTVGSYEVEALLGAGGMGEVYRARDVRLKRDVALKILPGLFALDARRLARFRIEAQLLASLNHPNIAQIYGVEEADGWYGLVLELVEGPTLADRIADGPLPLEEALTITRQLVDALQTAHDCGVVHRDLKPANIKVRPDGTVKVLDFGLAKALAPSSDAPARERRSAPTLTARGVILGTAGYMAPEQARGRASDARADVWAVGVTLYEMVTGHAPFAGEGLADTVGAVLYKEPDWSEVPGSVQPLLRRCLEKEAARRPQTMADVRGWLDSPTAAAHRSRLRGSWLLLGAATVAIAAGVIGQAMLRNPPRRPTSFPVRLQIPAPPESSFANYFAVSPDGRQVASVVRDAAGELSIWMHSFESGESRALSGVGELSTSSIIWSGDSRSIAFVDKDANLKRIAVAGGLPQTILKLSRGWGGAAWTGDGSVIVGQRNGGLVRVSSNGGNPSPLTDLNRAQDEIGHGGPRLLGDGRHFIYSRESSVRAKTALYVGAVDAAPSSQISQPLLVTESRPAYAPPLEGRVGHLLLVRDGVLFAYPFDEGRLALAGDPIAIAEGVRAVSNGHLSIASASASANGVLAYRTVEQPSGVPIWLDRSGRESGEALSETLSAPSFPRVSPDGRRVALIVAGNLWVHYTDGRPPIKLTFDGNVSQPIWTPDGRRILYVDHNAGGQIQSVPGDRVAPAEPAAPPGVFRPFGWTADGSLVAAAYTLSDISGGTVTDVDIVRFAPDRSATTSAMVKTPASEGLGGLAVSPDGGWLAYTSNSTGREEIWAQSLLDGGSPVRVSPRGGLEPRWAPAGNELYYLEANRMMAVPVHGHEPAGAFGMPRVLFESRFLAPGSLSYDLGPDGRFVTIASDPAQGRTATRVVLNWTQLLNRPASRQ